MVWEPGDNGVVEWPVAQWGFRQVHGVYFSRPHLPRAACGETRVQIMWTSSQRLPYSLFFFLHTFYLFLPLQVKFRIYLYKIVIQCSVCTVHKLSNSHKNNQSQYLTLHFTESKLTFFQNDFFLDKCFEAMEVDSLSSSHPVSTHVEKPAQIQEMFDDVSYDKVSIILSAINSHKK